MYLAHFDLSDSPFAITPDPRFVYLTPRHREALAHLLYGLGEGGGFVQLTGEVGTGKTTICRTLLHQLPDNVDVALIFNPPLTVTELLSGICDELHIELPPQDHSAKELTDRLYAYLIDANTRGKRTVLIIDEAQNLSPDLLEEVRLLTNLETDDCKLLQIFLIGQPELRARLAGKELRQLAQRITARYHLGPLTREETRLYVRHRLSVAGARRELFTRRALALVHRLSAGIPRRINILCERALLGGYASDANRIDTRIVRKAHAELDEPQRASSLPAARPMRLALMVVAVMAAGALALRHDATRQWVDGMLALEASLPTVVAAARPVPHTAQPLMAPDAPPPTPPPAAEAPVESVAMVVPATPMEVEIIAPPAPTAPAAPPPSPSLEGLVSTLNSDGRQEAARALARLWGETQLPSDSDLCTWAPQQGLACHTGPNGWPQLRALDLPALLKLVGRAGGTTYALLRGLTETTAIIELADQVHRVSQDEVSRLWNGESLVLWRPPVQDLSLLYPGELRAGVKWLRSRLAVLDGVEPPAAADELYDDALRNRVMTFQRRNGLYVDGIVGPQTWMFLSQNLPGAGIPSLDAGPWDATTPSDTPAVALGQP